ncbi:hypothetical protein QWY84_07980 [Aquisalimonas lutea]|uniref:hypothetical protein n=1 Tax=Aquisalimonas lutea TaxID=1327750 RepID=UPI0025B29620|nr:hypothetical protein [Aquisalimonas lutea]MDN3517543.1 hypothetical protein [Aquisalimonas lutea]
MSIEMISSGTWKVEDGNLIEELQRVSVMGMAANGTPLDISQMSSAEQAEIHRSVNQTTGIAVSTEIRSVTDSRLDLYVAAERTMVRCDRM